MHERHRDPVEPAVAERKPLGDSLADADAGRHRLAGDGDHLAARVDAPHLRAGLVGERGREPAGAAADVEHAPAAEVAELDERGERLPPGRVGRPQRVVDPGARAEVGTLPPSLTASGGCRAAPAAGAARDEHGVAPLGERDLDHVEVARHDGVGEELARLLGHLAAEVAARDVREGEQAHACLLRGERRLGGGRVPGLAGALPLVGAEGRLVDEQVDAGRPRRRPTRPVPCRP